MFAWLAVLAFFLVLIKVTLGDVDLVVLGFLFIALHLAIGGWVGTQFGNRFGGNRNQ